MPAAAELEIFMVGRELVAIEHDLDLARRRVASAIHLVLAPSRNLRKYAVGTIRRGHA